MSRKTSVDVQDDNCSRDQRGETLPSESLHDPVMTTSILPVRLQKENQTDHHTVSNQRKSDVRDVFSAVLLELSALICCFCRAEQTNG